MVNFDNTTISILLSRADVETDRIVVKVWPLPETNVAALQKEAPKNYVL